MKQAIKAILIIIVVLGLAFSISNFISVKLKAGLTRGHWTTIGSKVVCNPPGNECDVEGGAFPGDL